jgi:hypothetical protein
VTVTYDSASLQPAAILGRLAGTAVAPRAARPAPAAAPAEPILTASAAKLGGLFGRALLDAMLARGVERSVRMLVGGR